MKITVIGSGRWGGFIAWYLSGMGHTVTIYGRAESAKFASLRKTRTNGLVIFNDTVSFCDQRKQALESAELVVISIPSQSLRGLMKEISQYPLEGKTVVLCMKGIEATTGKRLTQVAEEFLTPETGLAIWVGPGHVQDFTAGIPNCMVIDSNQQKTKELLIEQFSGSLIRFYYGEDLIGNEVGAASKNVIGIAAGMLDGLNKTALKGALMSRGTREIARLIRAMGGKEISAYGLAHLGDYQATVFSEYSHNRAFGERFVRGEPYGELAEGVATTKALLRLGEQYSVELPICRAVDAVIHGGQAPDKVLSDLFLRSQKAEF
ncbi:NAD(P)H-dependent glycerol-3-phosphate dehydrogenase [Clostridium minihomine]|uniref:NAD(P)H-dependent glycerol-3-phosphate dehydrogenase n=1 Tax=Clostridium minihomine TaxID=2045012 RepID=UPI000C7738E5|nr:NAD(P)H-dependent glycerol-3-phosphate dehydrogenase [Clostridium minihomine]